MWSGVCAYAAILIAGRYQGDMKRNERDNAVRAFMSKDKARVMLMSLKCGGACARNLNTWRLITSGIGIGLNLTRANNVINLDLAWSQAIESQAFDRLRLQFILLDIHFWVFNALEYIDWDRQGLSTFKGLLFQILLKIAFWNCNCGRLVRAQLV